MSKFFLTLLMTLFFLPQANAKSPDTCDQIAGQWDGDWYREYPPPACNWEIEGESFKEGENVYFDFVFHSDYCRNFRFAMKGTCREGKVFLENPDAIMSGIFANNTLRLEGNEQYAILHKK